MGKEKLWSGFLTLSNLSLTAVPIHLIDSTKLFKKTRAETKQE
jgi:hypothetical protein